MYWKIMFSWVWEFIKPIAAVLLKEGGKVLAQLALEAVKEFSTTDMRNDQKRDAAYDKVSRSLRTAGIEFGESAIRLAIEMAVSKIKQG